MTMLRYSSNILEFDGLAHVIEVLFIFVINKSDILVKKSR